MRIPSLLLKQLYTFGSLKNTDNQVQFSIKNRLSDTKFVGLSKVILDDREIPLSNIKLNFNDGSLITPDQVNHSHPIDFPLRQTVDIIAEIDSLEKGSHKIEVVFEVKPYGKLHLKVKDAISDKAISNRQKFVETFAGKELKHISHYSFDPHITEGNCENFTGVAQIPIGIAGPMRINGDHAKGDFLIPMATSEGTLVASYNRGMKLINLCGGANCTVVGDAMQRAPVFVMPNAREGKKFEKWIQENTNKIKEQAEATSSVAKLKYIDYYLSNKFVYLRFNFSTGDAAGQNMVGRATFAACSWIIDNYKGIEHFFLESNFATDKKGSQINIMRTRGKRVTAEAVIKRDVLIETMRVEPENLAYHNNVANVGSFISGANNNGLHSANGITAMFIATGQDVANVAESSAGIIYTELTPEKDLYISITIPSLIVATYGGGTGLATQEECLAILGCTGKGKVFKLAEIIGGVVLAGELSLAAAISSSDWVSSHEKYGRNR
jgi:hydroxymethylglutaryl-CoA reductase (NADPH)